MGAALVEHERKSAILGKPTQLFHGTRLSSANHIAKEGFKLPNHAGLYGRGIYFADNPRKSADYAPESSWMPTLNRLAKGTDFFSALFERDEGQVLLCDVYLGNSKTAWGMNSDFNPSKDLKGGWFRQLTGIGDYNSTYAPGFFSHNEYIVYEKHQAIPRFIIQ